MAAIRYGIMMLRNAKTKTELENWAKPIPYPEGHFGYIV